MNRPTKSVIYTNESNDSRILEEHRFTRPASPRLAKPRPTVRVVFGLPYGYIFPLNAPPPSVDSPSILPTSRTFLSVLLLHRRQSLVCSLVVYRWKGSDVSLACAHDVPTTAAFSLSLCLFLSVSVSPLLVDYMLFSLSTVAPDTTRHTATGNRIEWRRYIHRGWRSRCRAANGQTKQTRRRFRAITHVTNSAHRWECKRATAAPDAAYAPADCFLTRPPSSTVAPPSSHCPITGRAPKFAASSHATRRRARSPIFLFHESLFAIFRCRESHWW